MKLKARILHPKPVPPKIMMAVLIVGFILLMIAFVVGGNGEEYG